MTTEVLTQSTIHTQISAAYVRLNELLDIIEKCEEDNKRILSNAHRMTHYWEQNYTNDCAKILRCTKDASIVREAIEYLQNISLVDDFLVRYRLALKSGKRPTMLYTYSLTRGHSYCRHIKNSKSITPLYVKSLPTLKADEMYVFDVDTIG